MKVIAGLKQDIKQCMIRGQWVLDRDKTREANYAGLIIAICAILGVLVVIAVLIGK